MSQQNVNTSAQSTQESSSEMPGSNVHFFSQLHVRDAHGNFVMASAAQVLAEAMRAIDVRYPTGTIFESSEVSGEFFRAKLAGRDREVFAVAFLNNQNQLIAYEEIFAGSVNSVEVHPREIVRAAMRLNAAAVILSHNHPSFTPKPSKADNTITVRIKDALQLVEVRLLDHIIVAGNETTSLAQLGHINNRG